MKFPYRSNVNVLTEEAALCLELSQMKSEGTVLLHMDHLKASKLAYAGNQMLTLKISGKFFLY
jgi:hypothetical protein